MTQDDSSSRGEQGEPGKKGLNLDLLFRPATAVPISVGTLYLYGLRTSDLSALETLPGEEPIARIRTFLPHIASLVEATGFKDERPPLAAEDVDRLSDAEVEHVAEVYAETLLRGPRIDGEESAKPERETTEPAAAYLDRLLKHEAQEQSQQIIAGPLNKQLLQNLLGEVIEPCTRVRAAVAYANRDNMQLFEACARHLKPLEFYGRYDHTVPVDPAVLKWFLDKASPNYHCKLVPDILHSKVIWWV